MNEPVRIIADWLGRASLGRTDGLNYHLALVDIDATDTVPADIKWIGDETRDDRVAQGEDPPKTPAVYVTSDGPFVIDGEIVPNQDVRDLNEVRIAVRYLLPSNHGANAVRDAYYSVRAIMKSIAQLMLNDNVDDRTRNQFVLQEITSTVGGAVREGIGDFMVTSAVVFTFRARDLDP